MRCFFQFAAVLTLIGALYPLLELLDRWDAPGLSHDTEFAVYALLFAIGFVLLLSKLIASGLLNFAFAIWRLFLDQAKERPAEIRHTSLTALSPLQTLPLRI